MQVGILVHYNADGVYVHVLLAQKCVEGVEQLEIRLDVFKSFCMAEKSDGASTYLNKCGRFFIVEILHASFRVRGHLCFVKKIHGNRASIYRQIYHQTPGNPKMAHSWPYDSSDASISSHWYTFSEIVC